MVKTATVRLSNGDHMIVPVGLFRSLKHFHDSLVDNIQALNVDSNEYNVWALIESYQDKIDQIRRAGDQHNTNKLPIVSTVERC